MKKYNVDAVVFEAHQTSGGVDVYLATEADARIEQLEGALKSCAIVLAKHVDHANTLTPIAMEALLEADKVLSV